MTTESDLPYTLVIRTGGYTYKRGFHTRKSAKHYAKQIASNRETRRINLFGPGIGNTTLLEEDDHAKA